MKTTSEVAYSFIAKDVLGMPLAKTLWKAFLALILAAIIALLCNMFALQNVSFADENGYSSQLQEDLDLENAAYSKMARFLSAVGEAYVSEDRARVEVTDPNGNTQEVTGFFNALGMCNKKSGYTVKLMENINTGKEFTVNNDTNITIDLNGHIINCEQHKLFHFDHHATVKLTSSAVSGGSIVKGSITNASTNKGWGGAIETWGTTTIENIKFENCRASSVAAKDYGGAIITRGDFEGDEHDPVIVLNLKNATS